jgi:hypothetical protein
MECLLMIIKILMFYTFWLTLYHYCIKFITNNTIHEGNSFNLIIPDKALVHSPVLFLDGIDPEHGVAVAEVFAVLHPADAFDGVAFVVAFEVGWTTVINDLLLRFNLNG